MQKRRSAPQAGQGRAVVTSWEPLAEWYDGWVGNEGSHHHRQLAIPALLDLLSPQPNEAILDLGAGQGVLAPYIAKAHAQYTGVDASAKLIQLARQRHGNQGRFLAGDVRRLDTLPGLRAGAFAGVTFLLSLQDMDPLAHVLAAAAWALAPGGRVVIVMTHPSFRVPRQSGWGWDPARKLRYRRVDHYLTPVAVPLKSYQVNTQNGGIEGVSRSFHRPLHSYINELAAQGLWLNALNEIPTYKRSRGKKQAEAENRANSEIPLLLALRAVKMG
ncbi:MAG: class I SAM-dependent methyltransferase [Caldilineaceae bacterium]|nr:class I SAM-dependent methyltransferase [Caldilineaceae bacterium]